MSNTRALGDKLSISLSFLCVVHCLATPVLLVMLPTAFAMHLEGEGFHLFLSAVVIPLSTATLFMGCRQHRTWGIIVVGGLGVAALGLAAVYGHDLLGETGEKAATVLAACIIASAHVWNYKLCSKRTNRECDCLEAE
ncbi:MAG: MerC domain-containing protein [Granulosicoccus sp.]